MRSGGRREAPSWKTIAQQVREAEELGYDTLNSAEVDHDPYMSIAIAAQEPSKLELGTGIALAFTRSPVTTAYIAWDLALMSGGRFTLGLGSQVKPHIVRRFGMPWGKPVQRMKDYVGAMRAVWRTWTTGEPLNYHSEYYNIDLMTPNFTPPKLDNPHIPVLLAAVQEGMLRAVGEIADGCRLHGIVTRRYMEEIAIPNLKKGFARSGRPESEWEKFDISGGGFLVTAPDRDSLAKAVQNVKKTIAFYGSTPAYRQSLDLSGRSDTHEQLHRLSKQGKWEEMPNLVSDEMVEEFAAVGTYADIASVMKKRFAGNSRVGFDMPVRNDHDRGVLKEIIQDLHRD